MYPRRSESERHRVSYGSLKSTAVGTCARIGIFDLARKRRLNDVCVLAYHDILPPGFDANHPVFGMTVSSEDFTWQMAYVKRHFSPISLDELFESIEHGAALPPHPLLVTFDDGHRNLITHALPILQRYDIPAVGFVLSDFVGKPPQPTWAEDLQLRVMASQAKSISTTDGRMLTLRSNGAAVAEDPFDLIRSLPAHAWRRELEWLLTQLPEQGDEVSRCPGRFEFLDEEDCRRLQSEGISIQSHGQDHAILGCLDSADVERQLIESRIAIEQITGHEVSALAYPFGEPGLDFGVRDERIARAAGYRLAFAATGGYWSRTSGALCLPRISIDRAACERRYFEYALSGLREPTQRLLFALRV